MKSGFGILAAMIMALFLSSATIVPMAHAQDAAELLLRLDRLEAENRRLTGQVEQQQFQVRRLEDQLKRLQSDTDFRFKDLEGGKPATRSVPPVSPPPPGQKRSDAVQPPAPGPRNLGTATGTLSDKPARSASAGNEDIMAPLGRGGISAPIGGATGNVVPVSVSSGSSKDMFDAGRGALDRAEYAQAETSFRDFLKAHPKDKLASEAVFGLGESYFARQKHTEAAEQYLNLTTKYGKSARAPEGMLKLGMSLRALGSTQEACATLGEVLRRYPNATSGVKAAVIRERSRAKCEV